MRSKIPLTAVIAEVAEKAAPKEVEAMKVAATHRTAGAPVARRRY